MLAEHEIKESLKAHPAPGWLAVIPIPGSEMKPESKKPPEAILDLLSEKMGLDREMLESMQSESTGIIGALLMEVGTVPGMPPFPFEVGDTVYFPDDRGIDIGDYKFLIADRVVAFKKGDDGEDDEIESMD